MQIEDAESLHRRGCRAHEAGRADIAIGLIGQAVAAAPEVASYLISLGLALLDRGHVEEARAALQVAVLRDGRDPRAHRALGQVLSRLGRPDEAEASLRVALTLAPDSAACLLSLGGVLRARGDIQAAVAAFGAAARLAPDDPLIWHALASGLGAAGELNPAEAAFRRVADLLPNDAAAQANLGTARFALGRLEQARTSLLRAHALAPRNPATLSSLGLVRMALGETVDAERLLAEARALAPDADAIAVNHGTALAALERRDEAETVFRAVLSRNPDDAQARFNLATALLARGALAEGWEAFEARRGLLAHAPASLPEWDGAALDDGAVLIRSEQGLGDTIQFLRWVPAAALRARVVLELPPSLIGLVEGSGLIDPARVRLVSADAAHGCTAQVLLLSLPHLLRQPVPPPMRLRADPAATRSWHARLPQGFRVGLAWAGSPGYRFDRQRSIALAQLAPLGRVAGVRFVSLQQGAAAAQALTPPEGMSLFVPQAPFDDVADTAALIASLDLVISVDTMIAHLTGALGKPVWLLDRFGGDWRWGEGFAMGEGWYPDLRRFVQPSTADPDSNQGFKGAELPDSFVEQLKRCSIGVAPIETKSRLGADLHFRPKG